MKVTQIKANQFVIVTKQGRFFQSYDSIIAFIPAERDKKVVLDKNYWDYSVTTGKYRNQFLNEGKSETEKKILTGEYILADLNNETVNSKNINDFSFIMNE